MTAILAANLAATLTGCGVPTETEPRPIAQDGLPEALRHDVTEGTGGTAAGPDREAVTVWLVQDESLASVVRRIESPITALSVIGSLGTGPSDSEVEDSLRSAIPDVSVILDANVTGGTAIVDLDESFDQIPAPDQVLAIGQLVLTLTNLRGVGQVRFQIAGAEVAVPLPDGQAVDRAVSAEDYDPLIVG